MYGDIQFAVLVIVSLHGANLNAQQFNGFGFNNFGGGNVASFSSGSSSFASSSSSTGVVFNNGGLFTGNGDNNNNADYLVAANTGISAVNNANNGNSNNNNNRDKNKRTQGQGVTIRSPPQVNNGIGGQLKNSGNPFLQGAIAATKKPTPKPSSPARPKPPAKRDSPATGQRNKPKPPKRPSSPAVASTTKTKKEKEKKKKNNDKNKKKKRVSEIKYEQYLSSIFPDSDDEAAEQITDFNGRELARPGDFPHMGAIGYRNTVTKKTEYKCGASLISNIFVITAAHCTQYNGLTPNYVRFGDLNLKAAEEDIDPQTRKIVKIINHPYYKDDSLYNDIALIQLDKPVIFTEFVRPIRLWYRDEVPFTNAYAMGFGAVQFAGAITNRLTEFNLTIIPNDVCGGVLPKQSNAKEGLIENQICAIDYKKKGSDTFQGDSGGPLQVSIVREWRNRVHSYLIGITSFGVVGVTRYPGVYTRVSSFVDWIEQTVWANDYYENQ